MSTSINAKQYQLPYLEAANDDYYTSPIIEHKKRYDPLFLRLRESINESSPWNRHELYDEYRQLIDQEHNDFEKVYDIYLKSDQWRSKRQAVINSQLNICAKCKSAPISEIHHLSYDNIGNEHDSDLIGLCRSCHKSYHD